MKLGLSLGLGRGTPLLRYLFRGFPTSGWDSLFWNDNAKWKD